MRLNILVCGGKGFIGRHICAELLRQGHRVHIGSRHPADGEVAMDFAHDTEPDLWMDRLKGVDAVVNAVGVLRDSPRHPALAIHHLAPRALFTAAQHMGIRRVVHISALGIENNATLYARSKLALESYLLEPARQQALHAVILRPSLVFGKGGASSSLFMNLARLPLLCLPRVAVTTQVQPVCTHDLAKAIAFLVNPQTHQQGLLNVVGPEPVALARWIGSLRTQLAKRHARLVPLPDMLTRISARAGDYLPFSPWCSETLALLAQDNIAPPQPFADLLGRAAIHYDHLVEAAWH
jgi:uncharacterized protein YbjT (DUF2867 family)